MIAKGLPLLGKYILYVFPEHVCFAKPMAPAFQRIRVSTCDGAFPICPDLFSVGAFYSAKQDVVVEPECISLAERNEVFRISGCELPLEPLITLVEETRLVINHAFVIH